MAEVIDKEQDETTDISEHVDYIVRIIKTLDGNYLVVGDEENPPHSLDDVYTACQVVSRNIHTQQLAQAVHQAFVAGATAVQEKQNRQGQSGRTPGGLVVPEDIAAEVRKKNA